MREPSEFFRGWCCCSCGHGRGTEKVDFSAAWPWQVLELWELFLQVKAKVSVAHVQTSPRAMISTGLQASATMQDVDAWPFIEGPWLQRVWGCVVWLVCGTIWGCEHCASKARDQTENRADAIGAHAAASDAGFCRYSWRCILVKSRVRRNRGFSEALSCSLRPRQPWDCQWQLMSLQVPAHAVFRKLWHRQSGASWNRPGTHRWLACRASCVPPIFLCSWPFIRPWRCRLSWSRHCPRFGSDDDCADGELSDGSIDLMSGDFTLEPVRWYGEHRPMSELVLQGGLLPCDVYSCLRRRREVIHLPGWGS